jgi:hypothetical protein
LPKSVTASKNWRTAVGAASDTPIPQASTLTTTAARMTSVTAAPIATRPGRRQ